MRIIPLEVTVEKGCWLGKYTNWLKRWEQAQAEKVLKTIQKEREETIAKHTGPIITKKEGE